MSVVKDVTRGLAPYLIGAAVLYLAYVYRHEIRDALATFAREEITQPVIDAGGGFSEEDLTSPMFGDCSTGFNWLINWRGCRN